MISPQLILGAYPRPACLLSPSELPFAPLHCLLLNIPARPAALQRTHGEQIPLRIPIKMLARSLEIDWPRVPIRGGSNFYWIRVRSFVVVEFGVNPIWFLRVKLGAKCCGKPDRGARRAFPVVKRLVGDKYFHAIAHVFLLREPPFSPLFIRRDVHRFRRGVRGGKAAALTRRRGAARICKGVAYRQQCH